MLSPTPKQGKLRKPVYVAKNAVADHLANDSVWNRLSRFWNGKPPHLPLNQYKSTHETYIKDLRKVGSVCGLFDLLVAAELNNTRILYVHMIENMIYKGNTSANPQRYVIIPYSGLHFYAVTHNLPPALLRQIFEHPALEEIPLDLIRLVRGRGRSQPPTRESTEEAN